MMKAFEHAGFWWDRRDPDTRWPGTLTFDPVAGAMLKRTIAFHPRQLVRESQKFDIIHGETAGSLKITLLDCFERGAGGVFANAVITGARAADIDAGGVQMDLSENRLLVSSALLCVISFSLRHGGLLGDRG